MISSKVVLSKCRKHKYSFNKVKSILEECQFYLFEDKFIFIPDDNMIISDIVYLFRNGFIYDVPNIAMLGFRPYDWKLKKIILEILPQGFHMELDHDSIRINITLYEWKRCSSIDVNKEIKDKLLMKGISLTKLTNIIC